MNTPSRVFPLRLALFLFGSSLVAAYLIPLLLAGGNGEEIGVLVTDFAVTPNLKLIATTVSLLLVSFLFGYRSAVGLVLPTTLRGARYGLYAALIVVTPFVLFAISRELPGGGSFLLLVFNTLLVGLSEELLFRGILLGSLMRFGLIRAVALSALLFAAVHLLNTSIQGEPNWSQFLFAALFSLPFSTLRLRTGSLLIPVILHTAIDLTAVSTRFDPTLSSVWITVPLAIALLLPALLDLRRLAAGR